MSLRKIATIILLLTLAACAHHRDVRPGAKGVHRVAFAVETEGQGFREAMDQAEHYCEQYGKRPVVESEDTTYVGDMDEETYKTGKTVSKVAKVAGGMGYVFGGKRERQAGGVVGLGGAVGDAALGQGYRYQMTFRCD